MRIWQQLPKGSLVDSGKRRSHQNSGGPNSAYSVVFWPCAKMWPKPCPTRAGCRRRRTVPSRSRWNGYSGAAKNDGLRRLCWGRPRLFV